MNSKYLKLSFSFILISLQHSCVNDSKSYYNLDNEQYIEELERKIKKLQNENSDLELHIEELEEEKLNYE